MQGKRLVGKGLAKVGAKGLMKSGVSGSKKQVPGAVKGSTPLPQSKVTAVSKARQPQTFAGNATVRAQGFTKFVN